MTKLLRFFEKYREQREIDGSAASDRSMCWIDLVNSNYSVTTLQRMLSAQQLEIRQAAAWALSYLGDQSHSKSLGMLLRDNARVVRSYADQARRAIDQRTQSPWHRQTAQRIEKLLASGMYSSALEWASHLVEEADARADVYMLRAWVRFSDGRIESAAEDCKRTLSLDPYCYQACVALGQCLWHLGRDLAAKECYLEAARIYPDWEPARAALHLFADR